MTFRHTHSATGQGENRKGKLGNPLLEEKLPEGTLTARKFGALSGEDARRVSQFLNGAGRVTLFSNIEKALAGKPTSFSESERHAIHDISTAISMGRINVAGISAYELGRFQEKLRNISGNGTSQKAAECGQTAVDYMDCQQVASALEKKGWEGADAGKAAEWLVHAYLGLDGNAPYSKEDVDGALKKYGDARTCCIGKVMVLAEAETDASKGVFPTLTAAARAAYRMVGIDMNTLLAEMYRLDWKRIKGTSKYDGYTVKDIGDGIKLIKEKGITRGRKPASMLGGCDPYMVLPTIFKEIRGYGKEGFSAALVNATRDYFSGIKDSEFERHVFCGGKNVGLDAKEFLYAGLLHEDSPKITLRFAALHYSRNVENLLNYPEARMLAADFAREWAGTLASFGRRGMGGAEEAEEKVRGTGMHAEYMHTALKIIRTSLALNK